jgi:predicted O-linked N-acetylglucosamine transferase (SPINDLY family)
VAAAKVLAIDQAHVGAHFCRALTLSCLGQMREAGEAFARARALDPHAFSSLVQAAWRGVHGGRGGWESGQDAMPDPRAIYLVRGMSRLARCDWRGREVFVERFAALVRDGIAMRRPICDWSLPFATLFLPLAQESVEGVIGAVAQRVVATAPPPLGGSMPRRAAGESLRVGYLSASFRRHPSAFLNAPIIHNFDPRRVKAHAYVLNPPDGSREAQWLAAGCALTRACHGMSDRAIAQTIRADGIHILLEVSGALDLSRPEVLRQRPAPINVAYFGALIPSGGDWIDYRIVDRVMVPPGSREFLAEQLVVLERTSCTYATGPVTPEPTPERAAAGLPATGTVLCCFNGLYKLDPTMFGAWMRVLAGTPGSVLWLLGEGDAERNLRAEAQARGVDPERLIFAPRVSIEAHLARSRLADLFLDTLPCNAHATAAEALHCGVPVLTLPGATAAGRMAASIVHGAGLPELVTASLVEYESTAIRLANDQAALGAIKARLEALRASSTLWNARDLAHAFERAFEVMWDRHTRGLEPASFDVPRV